MAEPRDGATIVFMGRLMALAVVFALVGAPLLALDRASDARAAMPCCEDDPCAPEVGQARECCAVSPAAPQERPGLRVERAAPSLPYVASVLETPSSPAGLSRTAAVAFPLDTSPSRPVVLRV